MQGPKPTKKESVEDQRLVQLIATVQKYQHMLITTYNQ